MKLPQRIIHPFQHIELHGPVLDKSLKQGSCVIPAQAEIHTGAQDSRLLGNDGTNIVVLQSTIHGVHHRHFLSLKKAAL